MGDIHGEFANLSQVLYYLKNAHVIQIGDWGMGFNSPEYESKLFAGMDRLCETNNLKLSIIRGNHDDAKLWLDKDANKEFNDRYERVRLISDYSTMVIEGRRILLFGGSVSIDRQWRKEEMFTGGKPIWWENEVITPPTTKLESYDGVIAHSCPSFFNLDGEGYMVKRWSKVDSELYEDLKQERAIIDDIFFDTKPLFWLSGHFHNKLKGDKHDCYYECIDINELFNLSEFLNGSEE